MFWGNHHAAPGLRYHKVGSRSCTRGREWLCNRLAQRLWEDKRPWWLSRHSHFKMSSSGPPRWWVWASPSSWASMGDVKTWAMKRDMVWFLIHLNQLVVLCDCLWQQYCSWPSSQVFWSLARRVFFTSLTISTFLPMLFWQGDIAMFIFSNW